VTETAELAPPGPSLAPLSPEDFRAAFEASPNPMLLIAVDPPRFTMLAANRAHASTFFTTPEALVGHGVLDVFRASSDPAAGLFIDAVEQSFKRLLAARKADQMRTIGYPVAQRDGRVEERFWSATHTPIFGPDGEIRQILSTARDVTAEVREQQATEARALLMREVDHRARNALAVVQSIVRLTEADSVESFKLAVQGRVEALGRAQSSLAQRKWEGAHLTDVVMAELAALAFPGAVRVEGPATLLPPEQVQAMSMVLHELATNAAKYGALSSPTGIVAVTWRQEGQGRLVLTWTEVGGPEVQPPTRKGFGSRLVAQLARQLGGEIVKEWRPEGVCVTLTATL